ncbi:MAG: UDP-N-acetylglucosamine--N-acetylmuramyl-(pentapeptide) pyrophosphoryl-undecaprenol N-acetylglucosamine transferase, partial [Nitrospirae bacterium]
MRVLIAAGGTGGHVFPGIEIARRLSESYGAEILFVGTRKGIESRIVPNRTFQLKFIRAEGLVGKGYIQKFRAIVKFFLSLWDAYVILKRFRPLVVIGMGGYASAPTVLTAYLMGIPTLIHEQNSIAGLTNKLLGRVVDAVAISYPVSAKSFPHRKIHITGNPVR